VIEGQGRGEEKRQEVGKRRNCQSPKFMSKDSGVFVEGRLQSIDGDDRHSKDAHGIPPWSVFLAPLFHVPIKDGAQFQGTCQNCGKQGHKKDVRISFAWRNYGD
jgi:hypothetical protein